MYKKVNSKSLAYLLYFRSELYLLRLFFCIRRCSFFFAMPIHMVRTLFSCCFAPVFVVFFLCSEDTFHPSRGGAAVRGYPAAPEGSRLCLLWQARSAADLYCLDEVKSLEVYAYCAARCYLLVLSLLSETSNVYKT